MALGLALNLSSLLFFKYAGFFWTSWPGADAGAWVAQLHLPLGISFFTFHAVFHNAKPVLTQTALMLSDSYGDWAAETFAGAFRELIQVNINDLGSGGPLQLVEHIERWQHIDRLLLLVEEGNARKIAAWRR